MAEALPKGYSSRHGFLNHLLEPEVGIFGPRPPRPQRDQTPCWGSRVPSPTSTHSQLCSRGGWIWGRVTGSTHRLPASLTRHPRDTGSPTEKEPDLLLPCPPPPRAHLASQEVRGKSIRAHNRGCRPHRLPLSSASLWALNKTPVRSARQSPEAQPMQRP